MMMMVDMPQKPNKPNIGLYFFIFLFTVDDSTIRQSYKIPFLN